MFRISNFTKNKYVIFGIVVIWIILSRFYDVYSTFRFTPSLDLEANPLISKFNFGWATLIGINVLISGYAIILFYKICFSKPLKLPTTYGLNYVDFLPHLFLGRSDHWLAIFYKLPKTFEHFQLLLGYLLPIIVSFVGVVTSLMWSLIFYTNYYHTYYKGYQVAIIIVLGIIILIVLWSKFMYSKYKNQFF